ncbi:MAG: glycosyltransferase [Cyanobacteria bacterium P01_H01_bin.58]
MLASEGFLSVISDSVCLCLVTDDPNAAHAAATLASVWHFSPKYPAIIVGKGLTADTRRKFEKLAQSHQNRINIVDAGSVDLSSFEVWGQWSQAVWLKLFIADFAPKGVERLIYLDTDTICLSSVEPLGDLDLDEKAFAAASEIPLSLEPRIVQLGIPKYFNTGVMVIDPREWAKADIKSRAMAYAAEHANDRDKLAFVDQCAINAVAWDKARTLTPDWNVPINFLELSEASVLASARIVHFSGPKPWDNPAIPGAGLYWHFRRMTPWAVEGIPGIKSLNGRLRARFKRFIERWKSLLYVAMGRTAGAERSTNRLITLDRNIEFDRLGRELCRQLQK